MLDEKTKALFLTQAQELHGMLQELRDQWQDVYDDASDKADFAWGTAEQDAAETYEMQVQLVFSQIDDATNSMEQAVQEMEVPALTV